MTPRSKKPSLTYRDSGVDLEAADKVVDSVKEKARSTFRPEVLGGIGFFGGLFQLGKYEKPVLVSSTDGVGTKLKVACALGKHDTIGADLVNHCVNDIFTCGAEPLFFLDYIAMSKLKLEIFDSIVGGMASACQEVNCALIGGETAEMPGLYPEGEYDLVGFIVGVVERNKIIDGSTIEAGDALVGLPSSGLHTNGYSLARKVFGTERPALETFYPQLGRTVGEALLEPHLCYYPVVKPMLHYIKGLAHITGGGLPGNLPRILPSGLAARIDSRSWVVPPLFSLIQERGNVDTQEMYRVFNMGIGLVLACSPADAALITKEIADARLIGEVVTQNEKERLIIS